MTVMPQFPLGSVLFPTMILPLHVFEERYRTLMADIIDTTREFGVPLIERGFEVGGEDLRSGFGTVARIVEAEQFDDGRWVIATVGVRRFRVIEWLPDDPYPRAEVEDWPDEPPRRPLDDDLATATHALIRCLATASEAGHDVGLLPELSDEAETAVMQIAALAPVSPYDRQRFLAAPGPTERLELVMAALAEAQEMFEFEMGGS